MILPAGSSLKEKVITDPRRANSASEMQMACSLTTDKSRSTQAKADDMGTLRWKPDRPMGEDAIHHVAFCRVYDRGTYCQHVHDFHSKDKSIKRRAHR